MRPIYDNDLPAGWEQRELRRLTVRKRGYTWAKDQEAEKAGPDTVPVIRIPNINEHLNLDDLRHLRGVSSEALLESGVSKDWILFVGSNGNPDRIGDSVLIEEDRRMVFASFLMGITAKNPDELLPAFLALWLKLHNVHETFSKTSQQTTGLGNFCWDAVKKLPVRFPQRLDEQQAVVDLLRQATRAIEAAQAKLAAARRLKTALMQQLFTRGIPGRHNRWKQFRVFRKGYEIPASWEAARLASCVSVVDYGTNEPANDHRAGLPVIAIPEVVAARFELKECGFVELSEQEAAALRVSPNDVLLIRTNGNPEYIGKSTVIGDEAASQHIVFASYLIRIRTQPDRLSGRFLNYFLHSPLGRRQAMAMANTSAGNHNLGSRSLKQFWIPRPDLDEQREIVSVLDGVEDLLDSVQAEAEKASRLKTSLLQNLLTGRVRLPLPTAPTAQPFASPGQRPGNTSPTKPQP